MESVSGDESQNYLQPEELCSVTYEDENIITTYEFDVERGETILNVESCPVNEELLKQDVEVMSQDNYVDDINGDLIHEDAFAMNFVRTILEEEINDSDVENISGQAIEDEREIAAESSTSSENISLSDLRASLLLQDSEKCFSCEYCEKTCKKLSHLKAHMRSHTGKKPFTCKFCCKTFNRSGNLSKHVRTHTGERPYNCDECLKTFVTSYHLKRHIRIHTGDRPYSCKVCFKSFITNSHLNRHSYIHTGEKPFSCEHCDKSFITFSHLIRHNSRIHYSLS